MIKIKVSFLLSALLIICGCDSDSCGDFTVGKFKFTSIYRFNDSTFSLDNNDAYITRGNGYQVEHYPSLNTDYKFLINWKSSSEYFLLKDSGENSSFNNGDTITVEITDCDSTSYRYTSTSKHGVMEGELIKIK